jgi:DNA-directed RNA polymerase specialized sigma24 family protein
MEQRVSDKLRSQCLQRVWVHFARKDEAVTVSQAEMAANWVFGQVGRNQKRVPAISSGCPETGIPDSYIDEIIHFATVEGTRVVALKIGKAEAWNKMHDLIIRRVYTSLRRYGSARSDIGSLAGEMMQHCACLIWESIDRYHWDSSLDAWVSRLVTYEVACLCRSSSFRGDSRTLSLESTLSYEQDSLVLADTLADSHAEVEMNAVDTRLMLEAGWSILSADQQEVVRRRLCGEGIPSIAMAMGRSANAIYKLQQRASASLQTFVDR